MSLMMADLLTTALNQCCVLCRITYFSLMYQTKGAFKKAEESREAKGDAVEQRFPQFLQWIWLKPSIFNITTDTRAAFC